MNYLLLIFTLSQLISLSIWADGKSTDVVTERPFKWKYQGQNRKINKAIESNINERDPKSKSIKVLKVKGPDELRLSDIDSIYYDLQLTDILTKFDNLDRELIFHYARHNDLRIIVSKFPRVSKAHLKKLMSYLQGI